MPFDVFLCHNHDDKPIVRLIANELKSRGLAVWLDEWELAPGRAWQPVLEAALEATVSAAVFVGASGIGPWQNAEMRAVLAQFISRDAPAIPVLLPGSPSRPVLPLFLSQFTWVDLRSGVSPQGIAMLQWGITGTNPVAADASTPRTNAATPIASPSLNQLSPEEQNAAKLAALLRRRKELLGR